MLLSDTWSVSGDAYSTRSQTCYPSLGAAPSKSLSPASLVISARARSSRWTRGNDGWSFATAVDSVCNKGKAVVSSRRSHSESASSPVTAGWPCRWEICRNKEVWRGLRFACKLISIPGTRSRSHCILLGLVEAVFQQDYRSWLCLPQVRNHIAGRNFESDALEENILWVPMTGCLHHNKPTETSKIFYQWTKSGL